MAKSEYIDNEIKAAMPPVAEVVQGDIFDVLATGNQAAAMPFKRVAGVQGARGRGRPAGSVNKRTLAMAEYLLSKYSNPVEVAMAAYSMPPLELLKDLGFKLDGLKPEAYNDLIMWAVTFQMRCADRALPYVATPLPTASPAMGGGGMMPLQFNIDLGGAGQKDVSGCAHTGGVGEKGAGSGGGAGAIDAIYAQMSQEIQSEIK